MLRCSVNEDWDKTFRKWYPHFRPAKTSIPQRYWRPDYPRLFCALPIARLRLPLRRRSARRLTRTPREPTPEDSPETGGKVDA